MADAEDTQSGLYRSFWALLFYKSLSEKSPAGSVIT
jgi:hypothetical protein